MSTPRGRDRNPAPAQLAAASVMAAGLGALRAILDDVAARAREAESYISVGNRNAAIGIIGDLESALSDASALRRAMMALHRCAG